MDPLSLSLSLEHSMCTILVDEKPKKFIKKYDILSSGQYSLPFSSNMFKAIMLAYSLHGIYSSCSFHMRLTKLTQRGCYENIIWSFIKSTYYKIMY